MLEGVNQQGPGTTSLRDSRGNLDVAVVLNQAPTMVHTCYSGVDPNGVGRPTCNNAPCFKFNVVSRQRIQNQHANLVIARGKRHAALLAEGCKHDSYEGSDMCTTPPEFGPRLTCSALASAFSAHFSMLYTVFAVDFTK